MERENRRSRGDKEDEGTPEAERKRKDGGRESVTLRKQGERRIEELPGEMANSLILCRPVLPALGGGGGGGVLGGFFFLCIQQSSFLVSRFMRL